MDCNNIEVVRQVDDMLGALILAGGQSGRIQRDKALLTLNGKPLLLHAVENLSGVSRETVVVIGKRADPKKYETFLPKHVRFLRDAEYGKGPLMGILTGMRCLHSRYAVVSPCDSPFVKKALIQSLADKLGNAQAVVPLWPNGHIEPLHSIYEVSSVISAAEASIACGELWVVDMIKRLQEVVYVKTAELRTVDPELLSFLNVNTIEDLKTARKLYRKITPSDS